MRPEDPAAPDESGRSRPPPTPPAQIRWAGLSVGVQGVAGVVFAVVLGVRAIGAGVAAGDVLAEGGYFLLVGGALVAVGAGLVRGRRWARTPAIVAELLLLPAVYSLLSVKQLVWGVLSGVVVIATFLLLISEASRAWSMDLYDR